MFVSSKSMINAAQKCFDENRNRFLNDPEKHDLYTGLKNLAAAVAELQNQVRTLSQQVDTLSRSS